MTKSKKFRSEADTGEEAPVILDKQDLAILRLLLFDSRLSLQDIGEKVHLSTTTCWSRIKRMEQEGLIKRYTVDLERRKLGYRDTVIIQLTLASHSDETLRAFSEALDTIPEVLDAFLVSGDYDYYIRMAVKSTSDYERLLREKLYKIPGIRNSKSSFVLRTLKDTRVPLV